MNMNNEYLNMKVRHQKEMNAFPIHFAFGQEQIDKKIKELKLSKDPKKRAEQIVSIGAGGFVLKKDFPAFVEMCKRHSRERIEAIAEGEQGGTYLYDMFRYELQNHEYGYTMDTTDTLEALGFTEQDLETRPAIKAALMKAAADIRNQEGFGW